MAVELVYWTNYVMVQTIMIIIVIPNFSVIMNWLLKLWIALLSLALTFYMMAKSMVVKISMSEFGDLLWHLVKLLCRLLFIYLCHTIIHASLPCLCVCGCYTLSWSNSYKETLVNFFSLIWNIIGFRIHLLLELGIALGKNKVYLVLVV